jgi:hypothetical protein
MAGHIAFLADSWRTFAPLNAAAQTKRYWAAPLRFFTASAVLLDVCRRAGEGRTFCTRYCHPHSAERTEGERTAGSKTAAGNSSLLNIRCGCGVAARGRCLYAAAVTSAFVIRL